MNSQTYTHKLGDAEIIFEINDWMMHAESSMVASMGDTKVMVAISLGGETDKDYMPLKVEYQERYYARGEILGGKYNKREGKPSTEATLTARMIDRAIRPYFPKDFNRDILVVVTVLSLGQYDPDIIAMNATALALDISSIPWNGTVGSVRVVQDTDGKRIVSPTYKEYEHDNVYDMTLSVRKGRLCMLETEAGEAQESDIQEGIALGMAEIEKLDVFMKSIADEHAKEKLIVDPKEYRLQDIFTQHLEPAVIKSFNNIQDREVYGSLKKMFSELVFEVYPETKSPVLSQEFEHGIKNLVRKEAVSNKHRIDGRDENTVRPLFCQAGAVSNKVHGSGLFYRGETHVLSVATLGQLEDALFIDGMEINTDKNFIHHYNFPPYSVGEVGRMGSPGRREIGHGQLAEKAFRRILPSRDEFPYTMRVVSEVLSSNGSTSMASVCGTSLALHDAGIPLGSHVAGIAIGCVWNSDDEYVLLTDILGKEDHFGDMDFKVAGTKLGITAIQMDCKFAGLSKEMIGETLVKAKQARRELLVALEKEITKPRELTPHVEKITTLSIPQGMVGRVIGTGGVTIKKITKDSGAKINIKRDGTAFIVGSAEASTRAQEMIHTIIAK